MLHKPPNAYRLRADTVISVVRAMVDVGQI